MNAKPKSIEEALDVLVSEMPLRDRVMIANMSRDDVGFLHLSMGDYIREKFGLWGKNEALIASCRAVEGPNYEGIPSMVIVRELWKKLRRTDRLRVVK
jgi:hypothetical protein